MVEYKQVQRTRRTHQVIRLKTHITLKGIRMGFFGKMVKAAIDTASLPVAVLKDMATMGGVTTDQRSPYTIKKFKDIGRDIEEAKDEL